MPGGLLGIVRRNGGRAGSRNWFNNGINEGLTGVTATVELAAPASEVKVSTTNLILEKGTAISLPTKIKLSNSIARQQLLHRLELEPGRDRLHLG